MINRRTFGLTTLATAVTAGSAWSRHPQAASLQQVVEAHLKDRVAPGGFVAISRGPELVAFQPWGYASRPFRQPVQPETLFHIGSCGKQVTALAVLKLSEDGKVDLSKPVGDYVDGLPATWSGVSISRLLSHTSGLPEYLDVLTDWDRPQPKETVLKAMADRPVTFAPGEAWSYSNTGYLLLGWVIAAVSGATYAEYVRENVFRPAALPLARVDAAGELIDNRAEPYTGLDGRVVHAARMESAVSAAGDGGVLMSARDAGPWRQALADGQVVSRDALRRALTPARLITGRDAPYAAGFFLERSRGQPLHSHSGGTPGFVAYWMALPEAGYSVLTASNYDGPSGVRLAELASAALEAHAPGTTWLSLPTGREDARSRALFALLTRGEAAPDPALLAPEMRVLERMGRVRRARVESLTPVESWRIGDCEHVRYRVMVGGAPRTTVAGWTKADQLYWLA